MTTVHEYPEFVASRAKQLPSFEERIDHALLGVITECGELADAWKRHTIYERPLDTVNVREELGDLRFYLQMFLNEKDVEMGPEVRADIEMAREAGERGIEFTSLVSEILTNAIEATSLIRVAGHGSPSPGRSKRTTSASVNMTMALKCFADLCAFFHFEPNDIIAENIAKLEKRYPTGYSNAHAVARLDKIKGA
jgi:NTP pyrophosphatase (non-canonical NTP hydrolase)